MVCLSTPISLYIIHIGNKTKSKKTPILIVKVITLSFIFGLGQFTQPLFSTHPSTKITESGAPTPASISVPKAVIKSSDESDSGEEGFSWFKFQVAVHH